MAATALESQQSANGVSLATPAAPVQRDDTPFELPRSPRISGTILATLAAIAGMAAIALGTWAFVTVRADEPSEPLQAPGSVAAQAISLLSKPTTVRLPLAGTDDRAILAVAASGRGMLVLDGLELAPVGRTYQAWVLTKTRRPRPLPAAVFTGVETVVPLTARVEPGSIVGITVERAGGAPAPSRPLERAAMVGRKTSTPSRPLARAAAVGRKTSTR